MSAAEKTPSLKKFFSFAAGIFYECGERERSLCTRRRGGGKELLCQTVNFFFRKCDLPGLCLGMQGGFFFGVMLTGGEESAECRKKEQKINYEISFYLIAN